MKSWLRDHINSFQQKVVHKFNTEARYLGILARKIRTLTNVDDEDDDLNFVADKAAALFDQEKSSLLLRSASMLQRCDIFNRISNISNTYKLYWGTLVRNMGIST